MPLCRQRFHPLESKAMKNTESPNFGSGFVM